MNACNSLLRFKHQGSEIYLAKYVFSYTNDTTYGNMQRLKVLADRNNMLLTGSPSTKLNAAKKRKALVQSHCMNRRQANLVQITDVIDINKELDKTVLTITELMAELVVRKIFTREQVLNSALNKHQLRNIIQEEEDIDWDSNISDLELSELFSLPENQAENDAMFHNLPEASTKEAELIKVKEENAELKSKIQSLEAQLGDVNDLKLKNEHLRMEVSDLMSKRGEQLVNADHQYIENALKGKVVVERVQVDASIRELNNSLSNLKKLVEESTLIE